MRIFFTTVFLCFCFFSTFSQVDVKVEAVYTLGKIPTPLGVYREKVQAKLRNTGTADVSDYAVTLAVSGANLFTDSKFFTLVAGDSILVDFDGFSSWNPGINSIAVSVQPDDNNTNNSAVYSQIVNANIFAYADNSAPIATAGFGTGSGILLTRYSVSGSSVVRQVKAHLGDQAVNVGNTIYGVVMEYGSIIAQSLPHVIAASELNTDIYLSLTTTPDIESEFMVGIAQTAGATPYFPVACQNEGAKTREDAYYASAEDGSGLSVIDYLGRFMIEAVVDIGNQSPFNNPSQPNRILAAWDFTGINSPQTASATFSDTILSVAPLLTRGPLAPACSGTNAFFTTGFDEDGIAVTNNDYFQFQLTVKANDTLSLQEIDAFVGNNTNMLVPGVSSQFAYSLDGINFTLIGIPLTNSTNGLGFYLANIPALQNVTGGNSITFRYYASGPSAAAEWGFLSVIPGKLGLSVTGRASYSNKVITNPVIPDGADFTQPDCSSSAPGTINFTSTGTFKSDNKYVAELGAIYQPAGNIYLFIDPVVAGTLNSNANSGTINFSIPPGTNPGDYVIRISSTNPPVTGTYSQQFSVRGPSCHSVATDRFRSRQSGDWADVNTWESSSDGGLNWINATQIPDDNSSQVEIITNTQIDITTNVSSNKTIVTGLLKILNGNGKTGRLSISNHVFQLPTMKIDTSGVFQIVSDVGTLTDVLFQSGGYIAVAGKVSIGDGITNLATGFDSFASGAYQVFWTNGSVFEWNSVSGAAPSGDIVYFPGNFGAVTLRLTNVPGNVISGNSDLLVNGLLEVNTNITLTGGGNKTFRDGIKGNAVLTQAPGCGRITINASYELIEATGSSLAAMKGIIDGTVTIMLATEGMVMEGGITIPSNAQVILAGKCHALQTFELQEGAKMEFNLDTLFLDDASLLNTGIVSGSGAIQFNGPSTSTLLSTGVVNVPVSLINKEVILGSNSNIRDLYLKSQSHLSLGIFNLNLDNAALTADSANYIITNDTGRLNRYTTVASTLYPIGINNSSYTPVSIINSGNADNVKVRVAAGVQNNIAQLTDNVDRTWFVGDTAQTGPNLSLTMQWNASDEQPGFDRSNCYISQYAACPQNCAGGYFDALPASAAIGTTSFKIERNGIVNFNLPSFIVTSKPFIYTFTGNGDWNIPLNWSPALVAPAIIPRGVIVSIDPIPAGECIHTGDITIKAGSKLIVQPGKKLTVTGKIIAE